MEKQLDVIRKTRQVFVELVNSLTVEQLNTVPAGFNNNIAWNFGHIIVSQQLLCYARAGILPQIADKYVSKYQKGTKPENFIEQEEIELMKQYLFDFIDALEKDLQTDIFKNYQSGTTLFKVELNKVQDAVTYFAVHDALHLGYSQAIKRVINQS